MIYLHGHLARPLDAALSNGSRVSVLRVLRSGAEAGKSGREIARLAGINHQAAAQALAALAELGLLERHAWGSKVLWRLDRRRWLVSEVLMPMLKKEAAYSEGIAAEIKERLKGKCRALLLTGDAARGRLGPGRPLPVAAVEGGRRSGLGEALRGLKAELAERWGVELDARIVSASEGMRIAALDDAWRLLPDEGRGFVSAAT
jgi:DNA-binding transcriptional ArsR family regulator